MCTPDHHFLHFFVKLQGMVRLAHVVTSRRTGAYSTLRPLAQARRGVLHISGGTAFRFCVQRCLLRHRVKVLRHVIDTLKAQIALWNTRIDEYMCMQVTENRLWQRWIARARCRVMTTHRRDEEWGVRRRAWLASEDERKQICCGQPREKTTHTVMEFRDCRACNLGVLSLNCSCYMREVSVDVFTCALCGDIYKAMPFQEPLPSIRVRHIARIRMCTRQRWNSAFPFMASRLRQLSDQSHRNARMLSLEFS